MAKYFTDEFYRLSELMGDDLRAIACLIADDTKTACKIYKDLAFGRYKPEYVIKLKQTIKKTLANKTKVLTKRHDTQLFKRDDFANIEAYSIFTRQYNKRVTNGKND
ncbi:hypothetical protein [Campylobacter sp. RM16190]|uniref:hypothetical protein n=1 Tax=Campylobacter sp. RM16190 TaxID=1705727 RepID=UPI001472F6D1|nr:hypothetical protein [Campylobacter sp. RM16190]